MKKTWYHIVAKANEAEAYLYGNVGEWGPVNSKVFSQAYKELQAKYTLIKARINSRGGDVFEGNTIHNLIKSSPVETHTYNDGIAASIGAIIFMSGHKRWMAKNAFLMLHQASGYAGGQANKMREAADLLDKINASMIDMIVEATGKKKEDVEKWFEAGKDKWFTAEEALKEGLIHGIVDPVAKNVKAPSAVTSELIDTLAASFDQELEALIPEEETSNDTKNHNNNMKILAHLVALFALTNIDASNEEAVKLAVDQKFKAMNDEIIELKNKLKEQDDAKAKALVQAAVDSGKITEAQKAHYEKIATADYATAQAILDGIQAPANIEAKLKGHQKGAETTTTNARKDWTWDDWSKKDPEALFKMKNEQPETYQALYDKTFKS